MKAKTTTDLGCGVSITFDGQCFEVKEWGRRIFLEPEGAKALMHYLQAHLGEK